MDLNIWLAFFAASWVIAISPGSGAVLSMSHGLAYGVRHTSATIAGLQLGLSVILLIAGVGVGALLLASGPPVTGGQGVGAGGLVWVWGGCCSRRPPRSRWSRCWARVT